MPNIALLSRIGVYRYMNKPKEEVKTACDQSDFAHDEGRDKDGVPLVLEHNQTKPEGTRNKDGSALDRTHDDTPDQVPLPDKE